LARGEYAGLNHVHLAEKLAERGLPLGRTTLRALLLAAGLRSPRTRRAPAHRRRRERYPQAGMLLQADGSPHRWLGPRHPPLCLLGAIDDATGTVPGAVFRAPEDAAGYLLLLRQIVTTAGIPLALYVDRHGIFRKRARAPLTLEEELGIRRLDALSPQAKGRIERLWRTLQDRLVHELRLAGSPPWRRPTPSCRGSWRPSMPASPSRRPSPRPPGGRCPRGWTRSGCCAPSTRCASATGRSGCCPAASG
jgi:hypothetical protein